jgi:hypothetical protein
MNYIAAASERNLDLAQLPKTVQKKIQELESLVSEYDKHFKNIPKESLSEKELESLTLIEEKISELDAILVKKVKSFDPVKYQAKVDNFNRMLEAKASKRKEQPQEKLQELEPTPAPTPEPEPVKQEGGPVAAVESVKAAPQVEEEDDEDDYDEFDKVDDVKPKSNLVAYTIIGIGVALLTWGAVRLKRK